MPDYARACRPPDYAPNYAIMPSIMSPSPKHFWGAHQRRRSVPVMAAPVMVLELMLRQAAAAIDKAGGYRACACSPLAQPSLVGSTCTVGEPAPPATP